MSAEVARILGIDESSAGVIGNPNRRANEELNEHKERFPRARYAWNHTQIVMADLHKS